MDLKNGLIFNRIGDEIESQTGLNEDKLREEILSVRSGLNDQTVNNIVDNKIKILEKEFQSETEKLFTRIKTELEKAREIKDYFNLSSSYLSVKNRRIVSVKPGVDKNDCVTITQLDAVTTLYSGLEKRVQNLEKGTSKLRKSSSMSSIPENINRSGRSTNSTSDYVVKDNRLVKIE